MVTRKSIGDKDGYRSLYVVEARLTGGIWFRYWGKEFCSHKHQEAVEYKNKAYHHCKSQNKKWARKDFRIALYVRAEE